MKILVKLTSRSRPERMFNAIDNIMNQSSEKDPWIIVSMDENDESCNNYTVKNMFKRMPNVFPVYGTSKNKIDAFNRDIPEDGWDIIIGTSDDIQFLPKYDKIVIGDVFEAANKFGQVDWSGFYDPGHCDSVIWYGDGFPHGKILTVPIMTKKYYDRLGYLYNPIYTSLFCDEEAIAVGEKLGKIYYSKNEILIHNHPAYGVVPWDAQYKFTDSFYLADKKLFEDRKKLGFPI